MNSFKRGIDVRHRLLGMLSGAMVLAVERTRMRLVRRHLIPAVDRVGAYTWTSIRNDAGGR